MTLILLIAHSLSKNENFQPQYLYLGTFLIDLKIIDVACGIS